MFFLAEFRQSVKTWLAPHNPRQFYERSLNLYQEGTGRWLLENVFQSWLDGCSLPILWLRAKREQFIGDARLTTSTNIVLPSWRWKDDSTVRFSTKIQVCKYLLVANSLAPLR